MTTPGTGTSPPGQVRDYVIDGSTCVNDVLFASLYASMDREVLDHLQNYGAEQVLEAPIPRQEHGGLSDLSEVSSSDDDDDDSIDIDDKVVTAHGHDYKTNQGMEDEMGYSTGVIEDDDDASDCSSDDNGLRKGRSSSKLRRDGKESEDLMTPSFYSKAYIGQLLHNLSNATSTQSLADRQGELVAIGSILSEVEGFVTIQSCASDIPGNRKIFDFGTLCCLEDRQIVGIIVDIMGPTAAPFYVVRRLSSEELSLVNKNSEIPPASTTTDSEVPQEIKPDCSMADDSVINIDNYSEDGEMNNSTNELVAAIDEVSAPAGNIDPDADEKISAACSVPIAVEGVTAATDQLIVTGEGMCAAEENTSLDPTLLLAGTVVFAISGSGNRMLQIDYAELAQESSDSGNEINDGDSEENHCVNINNRRGSRHGKTARNRRLTSMNTRDCGYNRNSGSAGVMISRPHSHAPPPPPPPPPPLGYRVPMPPAAQIR